METPPVRRGNGLPLALALVILAAGFAYAMPRMENVSAEGELGDGEVVVVVTPTASATPTATPAPEPTESPDDDDEDAEEDNDDHNDDHNDDAAKADNHGKAVSTAAHCDIKGKAHGELVRSIAHDKDATVADAEAACAAALAALAEESDSNTAETRPEKPSHGPPAKEPKEHAQPAKPKKPKKH